MLTPVEVKPLDNYQLWVKYSDDIEGIVDLSDSAGKGVFALWNDYRAFQNVHIGPSGEIAWNDQVDMCPDAIYLQITGKKPEDLFPKLHKGYSPERRRDYGRTAVPHRYSDLAGACPTAH